LVFTDDPKQQLRITRSLLSALVFVVCIGLIVYATAIGMMNPTAGAVLAGCIMVSCTGFYVVLRSGFNLRFAEPALTLPQILAALTWICGAYAITNESHGGTLMLFTLVQVFGIFNMSARAARISSTYAVAAMGATMLYKTLTAPEVYPARVEWVYFVFVATIMPTISQLAQQLTSMRERMKAQRSDLEVALARIQELATLDELTGLINRRQMTEVLADHALRQKRNAAGFGVAVIDLDFFKKVNDTYGHAVGDEVLRGFAQEARRVLRETDVIARWGGEEFLLIMVETPPGHPGTGLDRLRTALADFPISPTVPGLRVTFSAGLTLYRAGEPIDVAIERADKALYQAKAAGRDRTILLE
jgi:diguanylate cyclase (GGDEF)-like protein